MVTLTSHVFRTGIGYDNQVTGKTLYGILLAYPDNEQPGWLMLAIRYGDYHRVVGSPRLHRSRNNSNYS